MNTTTDTPETRHLSGPQLPAMFPVEQAPLSSLHAHPRNYRKHPPDQLEHIKTSILQNGFYRNIVVAKDNTILAGHGVAEAAKLLGIETVPVLRIPIGPDDPLALKLLTGDNEISHLGEQDDRLLTEILREVMKSAPDGLKGTGYDEKMLAALVMVTRPASEIRDFDAAAAYVGMPEYDAQGERPFGKVIVTFRTLEDIKAFAEKLGVKTPDKIEQAKYVWTFWWPERKPDDLNAVRFVAEAEPPSSPA